jgi:hypothetical protein
VATSRNTTSSNSNTEAPRAPRHRVQRFHDEAELKEAVRQHCLRRFAETFGFDWDPHRFAATYAHRNPNELKARELLRAFRESFGRLAQFAAENRNRVERGNRPAPLEDPDGGPTVSFLLAWPLLRELERHAAVQPEEEDDERQARTLLAQDLVKWQRLGRHLHAHPLGADPTVLQAAWLSLLLGNFPAPDPRSQGQGHTVGELVALEARHMRRALEQARKDAARARR